MEDKDYLEYLISAQKRGSKPGLDRIFTLLNELGNPEKTLKFIHVVGTNGKGSFCNMISNILIESGLKVGTFSSPEVSEYNEKIRLNGINISNEDIVKYMKMIYPISERMEDKPSQFEMETALAFLFYKQEKTDMVVLEAGMGGKEDATNVIGAPLMCVFTSIGLDHTQFLGKTIPKITENKAGILKQGTTSALFYGEELPAKRKLLKICKEKGIKLIIPDRRKLKIYETSVLGSNYDYDCFKNIHVKLPGIHQIYNGILVLECVKELRKLGYLISEDNVKNGIFNSYLPARFEVICEKPLVIYDGAHNINGFNALLKNLSKFFKNKKLTVIMGVMGDKAHLEMLKIIRPFVSELLAVTPANSRSLDSEKLCEESKIVGIPAKTLQNPCKYIENFAENKYNNTDLLIVGTLYFYESLVPTINNIRRKKYE